MNQTLLTNKTMAMAHTEMWDRFSYYGLQALLILYFTKVFLLGDHASYQLYGTYSALCYAFTIFGGWLADRVFGQFTTVLLGASVIIFANLLLALGSYSSAYLGLAMLTVGIGIYRPNSPAIVGVLNQQNSTLREKAFTIFYLGVNIGSVSGPLVYGLLAHHNHYQLAYLISAAGMTCALFYSLTLRKELISENYKKKKLLDRFNPRVLIILVPIMIAWYLLKHDDVFSIVVFVFSILALMYYLLLLFKTQGEERKAILSLIFPFLSAIVFMTLFLQIYASLTLFIERYVDRTLFGITIPTPWFSSVEPIAVILLGLLISKLWSTLINRNINLEARHKIMIGLVFSGLSCYLFYYTIVVVATHPILTLVLIVAANICLGISELCIILVTLSFTNLVAPPRYRSTLMGFFYFSLTLSGYFSGVIAKHIHSGSQQLMGLSESYIHLGDTLIIYVILSMIGFYLLKCIYSKPLIQ